MKKLSALTILLIAFTAGIQASDYSESFKLHLGEEVELDGYEFRYSDRTDENVFTVSTLGNESSSIEYQVRGDEIFDDIGETVEIDSDTDYRITDIDADDEGLYLDIQVNASQPIFDSADITTDDPSNVFVAQGDEIEITLELENTGVVDQSFELDAETHEAVETFFLFNDFEVSEIEVPSGETEQLTLEAEVSEETPTGPQELEIQASGNTEASETFSFDVRGQQLEEPTLNMDVSETFIRLNPGEEENIPVTFRNEGQVPVENIELEAETEELDVEVPETDLTLEQFDREEIIVQVSAPEDAEPGDYFIEFESEAEEVEEQTEEVRANITEESALRYIGLAIMIGSLASLLAVYRKFGRR